jgi:formylglycine-generating enzyme required for sulfatase activity
MACFSSSFSGKPVKAGSFIMGEKKGIYCYNEFSGHKVHISKLFYMAATEVTNAPRLLSERM